MKDDRFRKAIVYFRDREAGILEEQEKGFRFTYNKEFKEGGIPISVSLPVTGDSYESRELFPFFEGLLPEGWYLDIVSTTLKIDKNDRFGILLATCGDTVGAVSIKEAA